MKLLYYAPIIVAALDVLFGGCYALIGDWPRFVYWVSAAILTGSTLLMK
jgi:hypothetical protein